MENIIKNCGLIAVNQIVEIKTTSFRTLIFAAKDNGVSLIPYKVDINQMIGVELPAIFHADNHFVLITSEDQFKDYNLSGNILHTKRQPYQPLSSTECKNIRGDSWVSVGVGAATAIAGGIKANQANKKKKRLKAEAENQKEVPLDNIANELKVSTIGAKSRQEGQSVLEATQTAALQDAGTRAILGGAGKVAAGSQAVNKDIAIDLDRQQKEIDMVRAEDSAKIRSTKEDRQRAKLAALSSQYNTAADQEQQGYGNMIQGAGMAANAGANKWGGSGASTTRGSNGTTGMFSSSKYSVPDSIDWGGTSNDSASIISKFRNAKTTKK